MTAGDEKFSDNTAKLSLHLAVLAAALAVLYAFYFFVLPLTPGRMAKASAGLIAEWGGWSALAGLPPALTTNSLLIAGLILATSLIAFLLYSGAVYRSWKRVSQPGERALVFAAAALFYLLSVFALPNYNTDIYTYITRARVAVAHQENPHYVSADAFPDDPVYPYANHRYTPLVGDKLAAWTWLSFLPAWIAGDRPVANLLAFRVMLFLFCLGNLLLISGIMQRIAPSQTLAAMLIYGWNPVVATLGASKSDTVMVFFLLLGVFWMVRQRPHLAVLGLTLSAFVKLITLPLAGLYLLREYRLRRWKAALAGTLVMAGTILVINYPFWEDARMLQSHWNVALGESVASLPGRLRVLAYLAGVLFFLGLGWLQNGERERLLQGWAGIMLSFSLFVLRITYAWYHITLIAMGAIYPHRLLVLVLVPLTFATFVFTNWGIIFGKNFPITAFDMLPQSALYLATVILLSAAAGLGMLWKKSRMAGTAGKEKI